MPIPRQTIERAARAFKIMKLRAELGDDEIAVRLNSMPTQRDILSAATWAAMFELAEHESDAFALANKLETIIRTGKVPGL